MLRTRTPLYSETEVSFLVRLACVKYAASVRSEPGSNSPYKIEYETKVINTALDLILELSLSGHESLLRLSKNLL